MMLIIQICITEINDTPLHGIRMHTCHPICIVPLIKLFRHLFKNVFCIAIRSIIQLFQHFNLKRKERKKKNCPIYSNLCMCDCCIRRCVQTCKLSPLEPKSVPRSLQKMLAESIGEPV